MQRTRPGQWIERLHWVVALLVMECRSLGAISVLVLTGLKSMQDCRAAVVFISIHVLDFQFCLVTPTTPAVITTEIISSHTKVVCTAAAPDILFLGLPEEVFHVVRLVVLEMDSTEQAADLCGCRQGRLDLFGLPPHRVFGNILTTRS